LDFDGTILDTEQPVYQSWSELWEEHGVALARVRWQAVIGTDGVFDPWAELQREVGGPLDPVLEVRRRARRDELQAAYAPRAGVLEWLSEADRLGVAVAVASSSPAPWVQGHLDRLNLADRFALLVCRTEVIPPKPDPTSYREACYRLGANPAWSVAVEDSIHGVAAAVTAGLFTVAVPHGLTVDLDLSAADVLVASLDELTLTETLGRACERARVRARAESGVNPPAPP
jgi:HAD superfamily hydrolase (TIGR01509 family)